MNALSGSESSAASARLPALLEDIEMRGYSADTVAAAEEAVTLARAGLDQAFLARALYFALKSNLSAGKWSIAVALGEEAAALCQGLDDQLGEYKARYLTGDGFWRDGQITEAFVAYEQAGAIARSLNDVERQVRCLNMMAFMLGGLRDYPTSTATFDHALALCVDDRYEFDRILVVNNKAQMLINRAREASESEDVVTYAGAAHSLLSQGMIETIVRISPRAGLAARDTLAQSLVLLGASEEALAMFEENAQQADVIGDEIVKAQAGMGMSEALLGLGRPADALKHCLALRGTEGTRLWPALLPRIENATAKSLHALGRYKEAFDAFACYHQRLIQNNNRVSFQYMKYVELVVQLEKSRAETKIYKKLAHELTLAKSAAEEASRAKTEFLSNMSHELRTPLNAILGFTEIMRGEILGPIQPKYREYIQDVHLSGVHLLNLIDQLLDLSQAESGTVRLSDELVPINVLLDDAATRLSDFALGKGVTFRWSLSGGAAVRGDRLRLAQCFVNVLSNAIDLVDVEGEVGLTTLFKGTELAVAISASGVGLRPEEVPTAFERFGQGGNVRAVVGAGFGLPLAKRLIELHGGRAVLVSEPGIGTTVTLYFPTERVVSAIV